MVRTIHQYGRAVEIIERIIKDEDTDDDVGDFLKLLFDDESSNISVYAAGSAEIYDLGQAMGVIASTFGGHDLSDKKLSAHLKKMENLRDMPRSSRKQVKDQMVCKCVTIAIPLGVVEASRVIVKKTPGGNTSFFPACEYHFDLEIPNTTDFTEAIIASLKKRDASFCIVNKVPFQTRAAIVLSHCLSHFGDLTFAIQTGEWESMEEKSAEKELYKLRVLAGDFGFQRIPIKGFDPN